jgi:hypothetical protein
MNPPEMRDNPDRLGENPLSRTGLSSLRFKTGEPVHDTAGLADPFEDALNRVCIAVVPNAYGEQVHVGPFYSGKEAVSWANDYGLEGVILRFLYDPDSGWWDS